MGGEGRVVSSVTDGWIACVLFCSPVLTLARSRRGGERLSLLLLSVQYSTVPSKALIVSCLRKALTSIKL